MVIITSLQFDELSAVSDGDVLQRSRVAVHRERLELLHQGRAADNVAEYYVHTADNGEGGYDTCNFFLNCIKAVCLR